MLVMVHGVFDNFSTLTSISVVHDFSHGLAGLLFTLFQAKMSVREVSCAGVAAQ